MYQCWYIIETFFWTPKYQAVTSLINEVRANSPIRCYRRWKKYTFRVFIITWVPCYGGPYRTCDFFLNIIWFFFCKANFFLPNYHRGGNHYHRGGNHYAVVIITTAVVIITTAVGIIPPRWESISTAGWKPGNLCGGLLSGVRPVAAPANFHRDANRRTNLEEIWRNSWRPERVNAWLAGDRELVT